MNSMRRAFRHVFPAALLAIASVPAVRAEDDVVKEDEPAPPVQAPFNGNAQGRIIIMPGLRLQVGGQGQIQVRGNVLAPAANAEVAAAEAGPKQPYLGVVPGPVTPQVRAQIDLPEGVGLSIDAVMAGGPAEKAGVKQFDVIHKFSDQVVCSSEQLTTLVKVAGAGTRVPLTLVRGGREQVVEAVLEEHSVARDGGVVVNAMPGVLDLQGAPPPGFRRVPLQMRGELNRQMAAALRQTFTLGPNAEGATTFSDARGTVAIRSANGEKTVTVTDPEGNEVYSGPLDTDEDLAKVPEDYRDWVREVDGEEPVVAPLAPEAGKPEPEPAEAATGPT